MIASILGDLVSDLFHKAVRAVLALTFVGICLLGGAFATGMIHPNDLRPENVRKIAATFHDRVNMMKGLAGDLSKVDPVGVIKNLHDSQQELQNLGASENPYGNGSLGDDDGRSEVSNGDEVIIAGNY